LYTYENIKIHFFHYISAISSIIVLTLPCPHLIQKVVIGMICMVESN